MTSCRTNANTTEVTEIKVKVVWRPRPESNRGARICNPLYLGAEPVDLATLAIKSTLPLSRLNTGPISRYQLAAAATASARPSGMIFASLRATALCNSSLVRKA
jgi:hypothetical protein